MTIFVAIMIWVAPVSLTGAHHAQVCAALHSAKYCAAHESKIREVR